MASLSTTCLLLTQLLTILVSPRGTVQTGDDQQLLMILLDGFKWDYLDNLDLHLPGFTRIFEMGVKVDYLQPVYPTLSYPNYYTLVTGLYTESHGMISNYMYNPIKKEKFLIGTNKEQYHSHWWNDAEPLWVSVEKQNKTSYMYFWLGCEVEIRGVRPTQCRPYNGPPTINDFRRALAETTRKFQSKEADLIGVYFELVDKYGHDYGPGSQKVKGIIKEIDAELLKLTKEIESTNLKNRLNVMIFSDHGMADMTNRSFIHVSRVLQWDDYDIIMENGPLTSIWPRPGKQKEVFFKLKNFHPKMHVYEKSSLPERYHYKNNFRVAPITLIVEHPYYILTPKTPNYPSRKSDLRPILGVHGYDNNNPDMRGIFLASGPSFKAHTRGNGIEATEIYQIMCRILQLYPQPNNGTWSTVSHLLSDQLPPPAGGASTTFNFSCLNLLVILICVIV